MDLEASYNAFLTALDNLSDVAIIGPSIFSTMQAWPLPAITIDFDALQIGTPTEDVNSIDIAGLTLPMVLHIPIDHTNLRGLLSPSLALLRQVIPIILSTFAGYSIAIADMFCSVVPFSVGGEAFGLGFTLIVSET